MERGEVYGYIVLSDHERSMAVEALRADGHTELPAVLETIGRRREIDPSVAAFIMDSVRSLASKGNRLDAQEVIDSYEQLSPDR